MRLATWIPILVAHPCRRRSGRRCYTVLEVTEYRKAGAQAVVIGAFGPTADWPRNIEATPGAEVVIGSRRFPAVHRIFDQEGRGDTGAQRLRATQPVDRPDYPPGF